MFKLSVLIVLMAVLALAGEVRAQDASQKTRELVAALDKTKYKKKEKANVSIEVFVDVKNEPALRSDVTEYSGLYESDGYAMQLNVGRDGTASGTGYDSFMGADKMNFTLKDARVAGALLTATKVYEKGNEQPFEAVFVNRTSRRGANPQNINAASTEFGIGFIQNWNSESTNRVFLKR
jgi:hypothetical protein